MKTGRQQTNIQRLRDYEQANLTCARIMLKHPERWGGEQALVVQWARLFLTRYDLEHATNAETGRQREGSPGNLAYGSSMSAIADSAAFKASSSEW